MDRSGKIYRLGNPEKASNSSKLLFELLKNKKYTLICVFSCTFFFSYVALVELLMFSLLLLFLEEKKNSNCRWYGCRCCCCPYLVSMFESMFETLMAYMFSEHRKRCFALRITTQPTGMVTVSHFIFEFRWILYGCEIHLFDNIKILCSTHSPYAFWIIALLRSTSTPTWHETHRGGPF